MRLSIATVVAGLAAFPTALGGPITYGLCQTACNAGVIACYSAAGLTFGVTFGTSAPAAAIACSVIQGTCMAACAAALVAPLP